MHPVRIGIVVLLRRCCWRPLYAAAGYHWTQHLISQLAAQQLPIMKSCRWPSSFLGVGALWRAPSNDGENAVNAAHGLLPGSGLFICRLQVFSPSASGSPACPSMPLRTSCMAQWPHCRAPACRSGLHWMPLLNVEKIRPIGLPLAAGFGHAAGHAGLVASAGAIQRAMRCALVPCGTGFRWNGEGPLDPACTQ